MIKRVEIDNETMFKTYTTYLFKGMCSNGPLEGIVPHKLLLETSLQNQKTISISVMLWHHIVRTYSKELNTNQISSTYTTFKVDIPARVLGIGPLSLLSLRRLGEKWKVIS